MPLEVSTKFYGPTFTLQNLSHNFKNIKGPSQLSSVGDQTDKSDFLPVRLELVPKIGFEVKILESCLQNTN